MARENPQRNAIGLGLLALGVVFGDIGTSPLYAYETALMAAGGGFAAVPVASLIIWTLFLVVSVKYVLLVMRADYQGEGGVFALMALLRSVGILKAPAGRMLSVLLIFGAALLFGDGAITPAISVLSAVEGVATLHPDWAVFSLPSALIILSLLFLAQRFGTSRLGGVFGPVMLLWFLCLAVMGLHHIWLRPDVLHALNPLKGLSLLIHGGWNAWIIVGAVVLAVTGAEALYADLGHFGRQPILRAWKWIVFPALILNYLGQAAHVLHVPESASDPNLFFLLVPSGILRVGMVILATAATVIASQALISGVFSLSSQAMDLGYLPRFFVRHTSETSRGQIYIPLVNAVLGFVCLMLVLQFRTSEALAGAYGIAVTGAMAVTSIAFAVVVVTCWKRPLWQGILLLCGLLLLDLPLFGACLTKLFDGGLVPLVLAGFVAAIMMTWRRGRELVRDAMSFGAVSVDDLGKRLASQEFRRVPGAQVFIVRRPNPDHAVASILEQYRRVHVLGENLIILLLNPGWNRALEKIHEITIHQHPGGLWLVEASYGYMVDPDVPEIMRMASEQSGGALPFNPDETFFVIAREVIVSSTSSQMSPWRRHLFSFMSRNVVVGPHYLHIPADRLILYNWLLKLSPLIGKEASPSRESADSV